MILAKAEEVREVEAEAAARWETLGKKRQERVQDIQRTLRWILKASQEGEGLLIVVADHQEVVKVPFEDSEVAEAAPVQRTRPKTTAHSLEEVAAGSSRASPLDSAADQQTRGSSPAGASAEASVVR